MALYTVSSTTAATSPSVAARLTPKKVRQVWQKLELAYYRYEVTYGVYILDSTEKFIINSLVLLILGLLIFACVSYLPGLVTRSLGSISRYMLGDQTNFTQHLTSFVSSTAQGAKLAMSTGGFGNGTFRGEL